MGFFDKLFGGKAASETKFSGQKMTVMLPIDGKVIPLEQLPDETFASAILGPGCGVEPTGDTVYAPFDGTVTQVPESLHAVGMMSDDGIELLIHVGMDTVEMKGNGFTSLTKEGSKVKAGTPLLKVDLDAIRAALEKHGFALESVCDGETFGPLTEDSQRYFFCAVKQYTQLEG